MSQGNVVRAMDARRSLVERIAASRHINRSARLRDLLLYVSDRVLEAEAEEIHEHEVGHRVFGRPANYDTATDNIVRVHASLLRKRLEQYFATEGASETLILEIPKGNYAPVFHERVEPTPVIPPGRPSDWRLFALGVIASIFASSTGYLLLTPAARLQPNVRLLWVQVFQPSRPTDIVLDDAAVGLYQELSGRPLNLSSYFDRTYLRNLPETAAEAHLDQRTAEAIVLRRQSSFAGANFLWRLFQLAAVGERPPALRFARDYTFRDLKANSAVLLGNSRSNPWVEPFEDKLGIRWVFDKDAGTYYPVDSWSGNQTWRPAGTGDIREGYCAISLLPNLGLSGNVLIIAGTGGSAINAGADFLSDEPSLQRLRQALAPRRDGRFPYFETLIKVKGRSASPRDTMIVVCRAPRG